MGQTQATGILSPVRVRFSTVVGNDGHIGVSYEHAENTRMWHAKGAPRHISGPRAEELLKYPVGTVFEATKFLRTKNKTCLRILAFAPVVVTPFYFELKIEASGHLYIHPHTTDIHVDDVYPNMYDGPLSDLARLPLGTVFCSTHYRISKARIPRPEGYDHTLHVLNYTLSQPLN